MASYDRVRDLPVEIESYRLEPLQVQASHDFTRLTTVIHLEGGGHEGVGEDVTYSGETSSRSRPRADLPSRQEPHPGRLLGAPGRALALSVRARHGGVPRLPALGL